MLNKYLSIQFLFFFFCSFSQNVEYSGKIDGISGHEYLILLNDLKTPEISFSESTLSQKFYFKNIPIGKYKRCVTSNTFAKCDTIFIKENSTYEIIVIEKEKKIEEVVITNKKPLIQNKNGVLEVNVESSPILSNGTAFETLLKLPGVTYNYSNNSLSIKGKSGIQIQIDGESLYMSNNEAINYLKNISSSEISEIEINSSPSAKYDASGNAGIINFKTQKTKREGYYIGATFNGTQGKYYKQNMGIKGQFNTKKNRYMLHNINSFNMDFEKATTFRNFLNMNTNQETYAKIKGYTNTYNAQYEHRFRHSNLLINSSFSLYNENINQNTSLGFYNPNNTLSSTLFSNQSSRNNLKSLDIGIGYTLENKKTKLSIKNNYILYNIGNNSILTSYEIPSIRSYKDLKNESPNKVKIALSQIDYEYKIDSLSKLETGIKAIYQNIKSENNFYESLIYNPIISDRYKYSELILGGYLQYNKSFNKIDFKIGSRLEYNPMKGIDEKNNQTLERNYVNLFPFLNFSFTPNKNNNFNLSYNKRINRPKFKNLMPFVYYVDQYTRLMGNPELKPSFSHQFEIQYILRNKYIFSLSYFVNKNQIYQTPIQDNNNSSTILIPKNINQSESLAFSSNISLNLLKWWSLNLNGIILFNKIKDATLKINSNILSGQFVVSNTFSLPKELKLELTTDYRTPSIQGAYKTQGIFTSNIGISKSFFDNKLKISIIGNDIFKTYTIKNISIIDNQYSNITQNFDTHWIRLGIIYKLTKGLKKDSASPDKISEEIKSRAR